MNISREDILQIVKEEIQKINESKRISLQIPIADKRKTMQILNRLRMRQGTQYDFGVGKGSTFILDVDKKFQNKVLDFLMKNRVRVHGL